MTRRLPLNWVLLALLAVAVPASVRSQATPSGALEWKSTDGQNALRFGVLGQLQLESLDDALGGDAQTNLFVRRLRLLLNYSLGDRLTVFVQTDTPNLGKSDGAGNHNDVDLAVQDAIVSWSVSPDLMLDFGILLAPQSFNHNQQTPSLVALDYGPTTFLNGLPGRGKANRDYGLRARGYLADDHFEYRVGVYQGVRGRRPAPAAGLEENALRLAGRFTYWIDGPQKTQFYRGTSLGKLRSMALGVSFDTQEDYRNVGADFSWDQPLAGGNGLTLQANANDIESDTFLTLADQRHQMFEAGFYHARTKLLPYVQFTRQKLDSGARTTWSEVGVGKLWRGHNANLKFAYTRIERDGARDRDQFRLQFQVFAF